MRTFEATTEVNARPSQVIQVLTDPASARSWSPVEFEVDAGSELVEGAQLEVGGRVAARRVSFDLWILEADRPRLALAATGPLEITARYDAREADAGTELYAQVSVASAGGTRGRLVSTAAEALLAGGALDHALERIARAAAP